MAAERYSITAPLDLVRDTCPACHGSGEAAAVLEATCAACGQAWSLEHFDTWLEGHDRGGVSYLGQWQLPAWLARLTWLASFIKPGGRNRYRWEMLPCGCPMAALSYRFAACGICRGKGTIAHWLLSERWLRRLQARVQATRRPPVAPRNVLVPGIRRMV